MARSKSKSTGMLEAYNTTWTEQQKASWAALGAFIVRVRLEAKIGKERPA